MSQRLEYAAGNFPRPAMNWALPLVLIGTGLNYLSVPIVLGWAGAIIDRVVATYGQNALWTNPKLMVYGEKCLDPPVFSGLAWTLLVTVVFGIVLIRRRAHPVVTTAFVLVNLFAVVATVALLDQASIEHGLYP